MSPYPDPSFSPLPKFILKTSTTRLFPRSLPEALSRWQAITAHQGTLHSEEAVLQAFILSPEMKAQRVRVAWEAGKGVTAVLFVNQEAYFKGKKTGVEKTHRKTVSFAGTPGDRLEAQSPSTPSSLCEVNESQLLITPFADTFPCRLSQSTSELSSTIDYVKLLLTRSVLPPSSFKLTSLTIDMMIDVKGKWYFIGIEEYTVEVNQERQMFATIGEVRTNKPVSRGSCPTSRYSSPIPEITISPPLTDARPLTRGGSIDSFKPAHKTYTPQPTPKASHVRHSSESGFHCIPGQTGPIFDKRIWDRMMVMEDNIADLIDLKGNRPISFMTYRAWSRRQGGTPSLRTVDRLYAKKIVEKAKGVRKDAVKKQQELVDLKTRMLETMAVASVKPEDMNELAGKVLLERVQSKKIHRSSIQLNQYKTKMLKRYQRSQNLTAGERSASTLVTYAAGKMDLLRERCREIREKTEESGD